MIKQLAQRLVSHIEQDERLLDAYIAVLDKGADYAGRAGDFVGRPFNRLSTVASAEYFRLDGLGRARARQAQGTTD